MVRAEVRITPKHYSAFVWATPANILFIVIFSVFLLLNLVEVGMSLLIILIDKSAADPSLIIFPLLLAAFCAWNIIAICRRPQTMYKNFKKQFPDVMTEYTFGESSFRIRTVGTGIEESSELAYDKLHSVREKNGYLLIYIRKNAAYILHLSEIAEGNPDMLRSLLRAKLGRKYK